MSLDFNTTAQTCFKVHREEIEEKQQQLRKERKGRNGLVMDSTTTIAPQGGWFLGVIVSRLSAREESSNGKAEREEENNLAVSDTRMDVARYDGARLEHIHTDSHN